jgi:hypothetical protein
MRERYEHLVNRPGRARSHPAGRRRQGPRARRPSCATAPRRGPAQPGAGQGQGRRRPRRQGRAAQLQAIPRSRRPSFYFKLVDAQRRNAAAAKPASHRRKEAGRSSRACKQRGEALARCRRASCPPGVDEGTRAVAEALEALAEDDQTKGVSRQARRAKPVSRKREDGAITKEENMTLYVIDDHPLMREAVVMLLRRLRPAANVVELDRLGGIGLGAAAWRPRPDLPGPEAARHHRHLGRARGEEASSRTPLAVLSASPAADAEEPASRPAPTSTSRSPPAPRRSATPCARC